MSQLIENGKQVVVRTPNSARRNQRGTVEGFSEGIDKVSFYYVRFSDGALVQIHGDGLKELEPLIVKP